MNHEEGEKNTKAPSLVEPVDLSGRKRPVVEPPMEYALNLSKSRRHEEKPNYRSLMPKRRRMYVEEESNSPSHMQNSPSRMLNIPSPMPIIPSPMPIIPSPMPIIPSPMPIIPSPMPIIPSPMPIIPSLMPNIPSPMRYEQGLVYPQHVTAAIMVADDRLHSPPAEQHMFNLQPVQQQTLDSSPSPVQNYGYYRTHSNESSENSRLSNSPAPSMRRKGSSSSGGPVKDEKYYQKRQKNNAAAKKSRDAKKQREKDIIERVRFLEDQNKFLKSIIKICGYSHKDVILNDLLLSS